MRTLLSLLLASYVHLATADTMEKYMGIALSIPKMELKADEQAHSWARSARTVLAVTDEAIAQTVVAMNTVAKSKGLSLLCPRDNQPLDAKQIHSLLISSWEDLSATEKNLSVSEVALNAALKAYPCPQHHASDTRQNPRIQMQSVSAK